MEPIEIHLFCSYLRMRNYSPHTVENYGRDLRGFFAPLNKALRAVSWLDLEHFIQQQHARYLELHYPRPELMLIIYARQH